MAHPYEKIAIEGELSALAQGHHGPEVYSNAPICCQAEPAGVPLARPERTSRPGRWPTYIRGLPTDTGRLMPSGRRVQKSGQDHHGCAMLEDRGISMGGGNGLERVRVVRLRRKSRSRVSYPRSLGDLHSDGSS
jgi:hypothetical protein